ncbi:HtaA domain-containing protein [Corynebacterium singulare]|uniref:HtaA domain-containing protein n=1 Tax=Corynebacterium singulare TaxID=161899 RepID=UPI0021B3ED3F|nr:HtaA domain-containing protein [Corynebacterium singulare]
MRIVSSSLALALTASALTVPAAFAADAPTCAPGQTLETRIVSGTVDWGIKESFRNYITGPIARGGWTTSGAVTQDEGNKGGADFQFHFEVDPSASSVSLGEDGTVTKADIRTKDSTLEFEGHHGALYTKMLSPYVLTEAGQAKAGTSYEGYYVPGKGMTEYTPEDRTEENKKSGTDTFAEGNAAWSKDGDMLTLNATDVTYKPKAGTYYDRESKIQHIEGIDVIFMGMYNESYKPELDDAQVTLKTASECVGPADEGTETTPGEQDEPGRDEQGKDQAGDQGKTPEKDPEKKPEKGRDQNQGGTDNKGEEGSSFSNVWNIVLALTALGGMFAVIGGAIVQSGVLNPLLARLR